MVRGGQLLLIDVAFAQVRPSPWRQAVDLGNMMLVLAVRTDPARVYQQALNYFTEAELAEAFAATRGVASPTQLRAFMKRDPRDLLAEFRTLAPQRKPIVLQRWSVRRVSLAAVMLAIFAVPAVFGIGLLLPASNGTSCARARLRHRPHDDPGGPGGSLGGLPALHQRAPVGLDRGRRRDRQRAGQLRAELRPARAADGDDHPDRDLRHRGRPADPLRPARHAPVRTPAEPAPAVLRRSLLHLPRRLRDLPVRLRARRVPGPGHRC